MRASTRVNVTNRLFVTTFLVAFSSVALSSAIPCPAHTLDSDAPIAAVERKKQLEAEELRTVSTPSSRDT
ncbi:LAME_0B03708g1_1 [Lachancea meyersii CBS 8951]|uniref:LAME_0B03708g1_1 n=1 Tax=Lachancea meyersii CBS 8951 TaxID=1266667 RepID=A0A1G4IU54_9SACH|nr:LAME_0B03708g1_1 [Lachancea meyersii CBS 8951]